MAYFRGLQNSIGKVYLIAVFQFFNIPFINRLKYSLYNEYTALVSNIFSLFQDFLYRLALDLINVTKVTTSRMKAFSCLLFGGRTISYNSASVFS